MTLRGWMLFCADGTPLNCVGSWRVFRKKAEADRYYRPEWRNDYKVELRRVRVEVSVCK